MARACRPSLPRRLHSSLLAAALLSAACAPGGRPAPAQPPGDAETGRLLLSQYQCGACHAIDGVPSAGGGHAPPLDGFGHRSYIAGRLPNRPELLAQWIAQPQALVPGTSMPDMGVTPQQAQHMAAYLMRQR